MKITIKDVEYIAKLARLFLTDEEKKQYARQLDSILKYMEQLNQLDTLNVQPTTHVIEMKNVFREDKVQKSDITDSIISNAPQKENRFYKVKKVIE